MATAIRVELVGADATEVVREVIRLGDLARNRLGQLPHAVFREAAAEDRLLVATTAEDGQPVGYALFRLPRNEVALTHLCVRADAREHGVARALIQAISTRHFDRLGVRAKCRDDYGLAKVWTSLGFQPRAATIGRGKDRATMTVWWKDHGHPDLFTEFDLPVELRAAIDLNILRDLADPEKRQGRSQFLLAPDLYGRLELVVTSGMRAEIARGDTPRRNPLLDEYRRYAEVHADPAKAAEIEARISDVIRAQAARYPATKQDRSDLIQVAHAAAAGIGVFLTWDDGLINRLGPAAEAIAGMRIMAPEYVIRHLDELANRESYLIQSQENSEFVKARASATAESHLLSLVATFAGERRRELRDRIRRLVHDGHDVWEVHAPGGSLAAAYTTILDGAILRVPLLRLADHRLAGTLARHLLWSLRRQARSHGARLLDIAEPHLSTRLIHAADFESMIGADGHVYAPVVDVCGTAEQVAAAASESYELAGLGAPPLLGPGSSVHAAARLERAWWPAKIIDSALPCYVVPIRTAYSNQLFGYPQPLTPRPPQLSLGREHVYYHSAFRSQLTAPARILWYASGSRRDTGAGHFFAVSHLDSLTVDTPHNLHKALSYYGVFNLEDVIAAARGRPTAEALRLSNTELFDSPVPLRAYLKLRETIADGPTTFPGVRTLKNRELFAAVYATGIAPRVLLTIDDKTS